MTLGLELRYLPVCHCSPLYENMHEHTAINVAQLYLGDTAQGVKPARHELPT